MALHYVRAGATGSGSGDDWTNAYTDLPLTLVRGDTYYIATGNYGTHDFNDPVSGTSLITVKKATIADHGTNVGWLDSYGSGQAVWAYNIIIETSYYLLDGVVGSGNNPAAYGFQVAKPSNCGISPQNYIDIGSPGLTISNITVSHFAITACGPAFDTAQKGIFVGCGNCGTNNVTISHCYLTGCNNSFGISGTTDSTFEYNYLDNQWSSANNHGEQIAVSSTARITLRYNTINTSEGTATLAGIGPGNTKAIDNWAIYGNIVIGAAGGNGVWAAGGDNFCIANTQIYNNTHVNCQSQFFHPYNDTAPQSVKDASVNNILYNNLIYNSDATISPFDATKITHDYNAYFSATSTPLAAPHNQIGVGSPFVNVASDYHLQQATQAGISLASPFDTDPDGIARGSGGQVWSRGAYQYIGQTGPPMLNFQRMVWC